jgi:deoxyribonuclease V
VRNVDGKPDLAGAKAQQERLRESVEVEDRLGVVRLVAGADIAYGRRDDTLVAAVVVFDARTLEIEETATFRGRAEFPYVPGFLSFRESPAILSAFGRLRRRPDLLLVDGHGIAHPRRFGIASHLGLLLDLPTVGVAKSVLVGIPGIPGRRRGSRAPLIHRGERVGTVLRTREGVAPVYVSIGHRVCLPTAEQWVLACGSGFRLPEPTRRAHLAVAALR